MATVAPGLTAQQPFYAEETAAQQTMYLDRLKKIFRAGRRETAAGLRTAKKGKRWRDNPLITPNQNADDCTHQGARIEARRTRRNHSSSRARKDAVPARRDAIVTTHVPGESSC